MHEAISLTSFREKSNYISNVGDSNFYDEINKFSFLGKSQPFSYRNDIENQHFTKKRTLKNIHKSNSVELLIPKTQKKNIYLEAVSFIQDKQQFIHNKSILDKSISDNNENNENISNNTNIELEFGPNDSFGNDHSKTSKSKKIQKKSNIDEKLEFIFEVLDIDSQKEIIRKKIITFDSLIKMTKKNLINLQLDLISRNRLSFFIEEFNIFTHNQKIININKHCYSPFDTIKLFFAKNKKFIFSKRHNEEIAKYASILEEIKEQTKRELKVRSISRSSLQIKGTHTHKTIKNVKARNKALLVYKTYEQITNEIDNFFNKTFSSNIHNKSISKVSSSMSTALDSVCINKNLYNN